MSIKGDDLNMLCVIYSLCIPGSVMVVAGPTPNLVTAETLTLYLLSALSPLSITELLVPGTVTFIALSTPLVGS